MKLKLSHVLIGVAAYEVVAYAWNSYRVAQPGATATMMLPFDFISTLLGGYATATNPTPTGTAGLGRLGATYPRMGPGGVMVGDGSFVGSRGLGAYMGQPTMSIPTVRHVP